MLARSNWNQALSFWLPLEPILKCLSTMVWLMAAINTFLFGSTREQPTTVHTAQQTQIDVEMLATKELCVVHDFLCFEVIDKVVAVQIDGDSHSLTSHSIVFNHNNKNANARKSLVLVHGSNTGPIFWFDCVPWLVQAGFEVHCLALPGFGESNPQSMRQFLQLSSKQMLEYLLAFINMYIQTNFSVKPILVGHSFGGYLVSAFACRYQEACESIIVSNCPGILPIFGNDTMYWAVLFKWGGPNSLFRKCSGLFRRAIYRYFSYSGPMNHLTWWNVVQMSSKNNVGHRVIRKFVHINWSRSTWKHSVLHKMLRDCTTPVAMIWGTDDTIVPLRTAHLLSTMTEDGLAVKMVSIDDCWHDPVRKNGGVEFANAVVECVTSSKPPLLRLPEEKVAAIKKILDESAATWSPVETSKSICRMYESIAEIVSQHKNGSHVTVNKVAGGIK